MGKEYTEVSKGENRECENPILEQIRKDFPLPVSVYEAINLLDGTEDDVMEALAEIEEYERVIR